MLYTHFTIVPNALFLWLHCEQYDCDKYEKCYFSLEKKDKNKKELDSVAIKEILFNLRDKKYFYICGGESLIDSNLESLKKLLLSVRAAYPELIITMNSCLDFSIVSEAESDSKTLKIIIDSINTIIYEPYSQTNREAVHYHDLKELNLKE